MKMKAIGLAALWAACAGVLYAVAADVTGDTDENEAVNERLFPAGITTGAEWVARSDVKGTGAAFRYVEISGALEYAFLLLDFDHRDYSWRMGADPAPFPHEDPWRSLTRFSPGAQYFHSIDDTWGLWGRFVLTTGFEDSPGSGSWTYNPQLIGLYRLGEDLAIFAGGGVLYHSVDPIYYPVIGVAWGAPEGGGGLSGTAAFPRATVRYGLTEQMAIEADIQWDVRTYRLAGDNPVAERGFLRTEDFTPGLNLEMRFPGGWFVAPGIRWYFDRSVTVYDRDENRVVDRDVESNWAAIVRIGHQF